MPPPLVIAVSVCADQRMASATSAPIAVSRERTVVLRLSSSIAVVPIGVSRWRPRSASYFATTSAISGSGRHRGGVDHAKLRPPGHQALAVLLLDADRHVDRGDVVRVVVRFHHGGVAVIVDEEIVGVAGEDEIDRIAAIELGALLAGDMRDRDHEVGALALERPGLLDQRCDRG